MLLELLLAEWLRYDERSSPSHRSIVPVWNDHIATGYEPLGRGTIMIAKPKKRAKLRASQKSLCRNCARKDKILARLTSSANGTPPKQLYFDEQWVAVRWGLSVKTIQKMRYSGTGPKWQRPFGRPIRYRLRDIIAFERRKRTTDSSDE